MKITFCGAAKYVTGSCHLITLDDGFKILLDCGLFQGKGKEIWDLNNFWNFDPADIDVLIVSHAHIDHIGRIPQLVKDGFEGEIYCTNATRSLSSIMLLDSAKIQESDVEYYNRKVLVKRKKNKKQLRVPLYTSKHVGPAMALFTGCPYDKWIKINKDIEILFRDAGHILGSASVTLRIQENDTIKTIGYTGDIGRPNRPILKDPKPMPEVDYLICESTYGNRDHELPPEQKARLLEVIIDACIKRKGKLIIPAFSLGRTQEIIYMLDKLESSGQLPKINVYVDSPLAVNATTVFIAHPECYDATLHEYMLQDNNPFGFNTLHYITHIDKSKALNHTNEPCIIISASGMMNAGRVVHHLYHNIENPNSTFLIVGYSSPGTPGNLLQNGAEAIKIFDEWKIVKAKIEIMDSFSAHGDRVEMLNFIENQKETAKEIFLVHGEYNTQIAFSEFLMEKGFQKISIPSLGESFEI